MVRIFLADDHQVVRQGFRFLLESEPDFEVVGEASDLIETLDLIAHLMPHVLILDLTMPRDGDEHVSDKSYFTRAEGLKILTDIRKCSPDTRIVILSMHTDEAYVLQALRGGALAYVSKQSDATVLIHAVREALHGRRYIGPPLSEKAIEAYIERSNETPFDSFETLTAREREIFHLTVKGESAPDIGRLLGISQRTVETHRSNCMRKLQLHNQFEMYRYAIQRGFVSLD
ncbi:MAG: response regulator transcription factor [Chloroflexaceae bacterium]|nr:response regulator transcription factor [Chloroflexaceae bacterium]